MAAAARVGDKHRCAKTRPIAHVGGEILAPASRTVLIGALPAARVGDRARCEGGAQDVIVNGEPTVLISGRPAARVGDVTHGGVITTGDATVQIGPPARRARRRSAT